MFEARGRSCVAMPIGPGTCLLATQAAAPLLPILMEAEGNEDVGFIRSGRAVCLGAAEMGIQCRRVNDRVHSGKHVPSRA